MVAVVMVAVALLFLLLRYTRLGVRIRAGTLDLETVSALGINVRMLRSLNFAVGIFLAGLSGVLAAGQLGLEPTMGTGLLMPSFIAIIVGGIGSLPGTLVGGLLIGVASGLTAVFYPAASEAVIYVLMAVVLLFRPRGLFGEEGMMTLSAEQTRKLIVLAAIWAILILAPLWMAPLGGYTALATRVLVLGTGGHVGEFPARIYRRAVFGHAAYFGLGAYGAGLTLKFLAPSTPLASFSECCSAASAAPFSAR